MEQKKHPFEPVIDSNSKILILGSLPSIVSVEKGFYYMHPQNRFWKVLSEIYQEDAYSMSIEEKRNFILRHQLALFDVVASCQIHKSSDQSISFVEVQDIKSLIMTSAVKKILLNGKKAYSLFLKEYPEYQSIAVVLPSTSSANAKLTLEELVKLWRRYLIN